MDEVSEGVLRDVGGDVSFRFCNGNEARSLSEFQEHLAGLDEDTFRHHASDGKNDFSAWLKDVVGDERLARDMENATREQALALVKARLTFLSRTLEDE